MLHDALLAGCSVDSSVAAMGFSRPSLLDFLRGVQCRQGIIVGTFCRLQAIVDFVLRDPREKEEEKKPAVVLPHRAELDVVPKPWHKSYLTALEVAKDMLHVTNPCMLQVLELWHTSFR